MRKPDVIWWNGKIVPWDEATVHVTSETSLRGLNVFEGLRAYWRAGSHSYGIVGLTAHLDRLENSTRLLHIPIQDLKASIHDGVRDLLNALRVPSDLYLRPTIYVDSGGYEIDPSAIVTGSFISWRPTPQSTQRELKCGVSSWTHISPSALPSAAKIGANYTAFRLARLEVVAKGMDEAILLNQQGQVAETPGGSVFIMRNGRFITPPLDAGILPSITRRIVMESLCPALEIACEERTIEVQDLVAADGAMITGTLDEISRVVSIDGHTFDRGCEHGDAITRVADAFRALCMADDEQAAHWIHAFQMNDGPR